MNTYANNDTEQNVMPISNDVPYIWDSWYRYDAGQQHFHVYYLNVDDHALAIDLECRFYAKIGYATTRDFESFEYHNHNVITATELTESRDNTAIWTGSQITFGEQNTQLMAFTSRDMHAPCSFGDKQPMTQHISFATSYDCVNWQRVKGMHVDADSRFYTTESIKGDVTVHGWRDPFMFRIPGDNHAYMLLTANGKGLEHGIRGERNGKHGVIGLLRTTRPNDLRDWEATGITYAVDVPEAEVPRLYIDGNTGKPVICYSCKNDAAYVPHKPQAHEIEYGFYGFYVDFDTILETLRTKAPDEHALTWVPPEARLPLLGRGEDCLYACQVIAEMNGEIFGFDTNIGGMRISKVRTLPHFQPANTDFHDFHLSLEEAES